MSNTALNRTSVALLTNNSGGSVAQGDVVIVDSAQASSFTTTTTGAYASGSVGVVLEPNGIASAATGTVAFGGYVPKVNLASSATLGQLIKTHTVAKQATPHAAPIIAGDFGQVLATGTAPAAFLFNQPSAASSSSGTLELTDGTTDLTSVTKITTTGAVVGGSSAAATLTAHMVRIAQSVVTGATAANINFSSIPGTYSRLMITLDCRGDVASGNTQANLTFNSDTAANYDYEIMLAHGSTPTSSESIGGTAIQIGWIAGSTAPTGVSSSIITEINNYAGTTFQKALHSRSSLKVANSTTNVWTNTISGFWRSTAAITTITITPASGNFVTGTTATLYGMY